MNATTFTLATNASTKTTVVSVDDFDNDRWWILLVFYALVPVAGCTYVGVVLPRESGAPDDPIEYAVWLEERSKGRDGFLLPTTIAPFDRSTMVRDGPSDDTCT